MHVWYRSAFIAASLSVVLGATHLAPQSPPLWGQLSAGQHGVGFRRVWTLDQTRVWPRSTAIDSLEGVIARPVRIDVWYPATCSKGATGTLRAYLEAAPPEPTYRELAKLTRAWDEYSYRGLAGDSATFDRIMTIPTAACSDARAVPGRHPLVVYSAGWFNRTPDNTVLFEFLASHGYVVASLPQINPGLWTYNFRSDPIAVEQQARDLEVALALVGSTPMVDRRRVAVMGYSTGGDVALIVAARHPLVRAVVGIDASWTLGAGNAVLTASQFVPAAVRVPVLALRRPRTGAGADSVLALLRGAPRLVGEVADGSHGSFADDVPIRLWLGRETTASGVAHDRGARAVLSFLNAVIDARNTDHAAVLAEVRRTGIDARLMKPLADTTASPR